MSRGTCEPRRFRRIRLDQDVLSFDLRRDGRRPPVETSRAQHSLRRRPTGTGTGTEANRRSLEGLGGIARIHDFARQSELRQGSVVRTLGASAVRRPETAVVQCAPRTGTQFGPSTRTRKGSLRPAFPGTASPRLPTATLRLRTQRRRSFEPLAPATSERTSTATSGTSTATIAALRAVPTFEAPFDFDFDATSEPLSALAFNPVPPPFNVGDASTPLAATWQLDVDRDFAAFDHNATQRDRNAVGTAPKRIRLRVPFGLVPQRRSGLAGAASLPSPQRRSSFDALVPATSELEFDRDVGDFDRKLRSSFATFRLRPRNDRATSERHGCRPISTNTATSELGGAKRSEPISAATSELGRRPIRSR